MDWTAITKLGEHEQILQFLGGQYKTIEDKQDKILSAILELKLYPKSNAVPSSATPEASPGFMEAILPVAPTLFSMTPVFREYPLPPTHSQVNCASVGGFLLQCSLVFGCSSRFFPDDALKLLYFKGSLLHLLSDRYI